MSINRIIYARKLVNFIENESDFRIIPSNICPYKDHIGALFTDIILQAGINYKYIVSPRANRVFYEYPDTKTVIKFNKLIQKEGLEKIIVWNNQIKLQRMYNLIEFCLEKKINTAQELKEFLIDGDNKNYFLDINGIGNKTYDYLLKLLDVETIAIDRHIHKFLESAGIGKTDYLNSKYIVEFAADLMNVSRRSIDYSIWTYMAYKEKNNSQQITMSLYQNGCK